MPRSSDGTVTEYKGTAPYRAYSVGGTPSQAVRHALFELLDVPPDLLVSGINYGENLGTCVTISGTVGAAIEAAALGIPSVAVSLQMREDLNYSHSEVVDFYAAAYFARLAAGMLLSLKEVPDIDILKVDVPQDATPSTPWMFTRISRQYYYHPVKPERKKPTDPGPFTYRVEFDSGNVDPVSDIHAVWMEKKVSISPMSVDMSSRVDLSRLAEYLGNEP